MIVIRSLLLAAAAATLLQGCAFFRGNYDDDFKQEDVESIKIGSSTRQDVATILGAPERVIAVHDQQIFHYYNYAVKSGTVLFFSRTNVVGNDLYVFFSPDGIVQQVVLGRQKPPPKLQFWPFGD
ncbi:MAG TPA: outer membrane protein assembly factor BamE [Nitrospiraceae bacterium]|nr:outer membrane protein assembly factor BamE [Nitrospiraceae bacterium]